MSKYQAEIDAVAAALKEAGVQLTLRIFSHGSIENEPWKGAPSTPVESEPFGVFFKYKENDVDGENIRREDQKVVIPAKGLSLPADVTGLVIFRGEEWKIIRVNKLAPAGDPIFYSLQVRR